MSAGAVCPACGVAVMPGYVRCPKCRKPLPRRLTTQVQGGTAVEDTSRGKLYAIIAAAAVGIGLLLFFGLSGGDDKPKAPAIAPVQNPTEQDTPTGTETTVSVQDQPANTQTVAAAPDPGALAAELERGLKRQRLWASVSVSGDRVEVRSGSCADPAMGPMLDAAAAGFKAAGVTKLRCVEQGGRVVTDRDL